MKTLIIAALFIGSIGMAHAQQSGMDAALDQLVGSITASTVQLKMQIQADNRRIVSLEAQVADLQKQLADAKAAGHTP